jgi:hypothetical protein
MHKCLFAFLMAVTLAGAVLAEPFDDATAAFDRGDYATALRLFRPLADAGDPVAQYVLGSMYGNGRGVPQDYAEAVEWYRRAADQGNAKAQSNLGFMYSSGYGVLQDYAEAVKWYRKGADQGDAETQRALGMMYATGQGVPGDYVEAHKWLNLAASRYPAGAEDRDKAVKMRDTVASKMTPAQIAEAQKLAREWKPK